eukprot:1494550-Rhodomonas_salina.1
MMPRRRGRGIPHARIHEKCGLPPLLCNEGNGIVLGIPSSYAGINGSETETNFSVRRFLLFLGMRGRFFGALSFAVFLAVLWLSVCSHSHLSAGGRLRQHAMGAFRHHPSSTLGSFVLEPRNLALRGGSQELDPPGCVEEEDEEENTSDGSDAEGA